MGPSVYGTKQRPADRADKSGMPPTAGSPTSFPLIGQAPVWTALLERAKRVAPTRTPVLVTGESGTGKELVARLLAERGPEPEGPCVIVNCGALPRELAESELFGHERGAFTGAAGRRTGWFEEAAGGTLILDEVGELPLDLQPKLLRVLETGRFRRVGGQGDTCVRVRVVAVTLRDLREESERGAFRIDLFHRLAGFELAVPPLRTRRSDIPLLAEHYLKESEKETGPRVLGEEASAVLSRHDWPGNVRELKNVIRKAATLSEQRIDVRHLELETPRCEIRLASRAADAEPPGDVIAIEGKTFDVLSREIFLWHLRRTGSRRRAAAALGISRSTFCDRVKRLGIAPAAPRF